MELEDPIDHASRHAGCSIATAKGLGNGLPLHRNPLLIGSEERAALVAEMLVVRARRIAGGTREPIRIRAEVTVSIEDLGSGSHEPRTSFVRQAAAAETGRHSGH